MYLAFLIVTLLFALTLRRYSRPFDSERRRCTTVPPPPCPGRGSLRPPR